MESLIVTIIISFLATLIATPKIKRFLEGAGIIAIDMQKKEQPKMATSGGVPIMIGLLAGLFGYIFITTFITKANTNITLLFASIISVMIITILGFLDDINIQTLRNSKSKEKDIRVGLKQW